MAAHLRDVDGHEYVAFCLGDTDSMAGHAPRATVAAVARQAARGITLMLPTEDANWVAEELARRFGLPYWQFTLTATDANRSVIRWAREITGRPRIAVHNDCYHGSVDEALAMLDGASTVARRGNVGPPVPLETTTRVVEFNDLAAIERDALPWHVVRLGCRVEYLFRPQRARNGSEARGVLMTPFHNMALMSPATTEDDVDLHTRLFGEMASEIV